MAGKVQTLSAVIDDLSMRYLNFLTSRPRKRAEKPEAKVRERRGNSKVPSYKDLYSTSSSSEEDIGIPTLMDINFNILLLLSDKVYHRIVKLVPMHFNGLTGSSDSFSNFESLAPLVSKLEIYR